jgi:hypothetical protein
MAAPKRATPRVLEHVERLREAGLDTQKFFDALVQLRDDGALPKKHREALYKWVAMESFIWYLEALRNERVDRMAMRDAAMKIAEEHEAAIRKQQEGGEAEALAKADISAKKPGQGAPAGASPPRKRPAGKPKPAAGKGPRKPPRPRKKR